MTSMSDLGRVLIETLSDKLYSTRRDTDLKHWRMNWPIHAPRKTLIAHEINIIHYTGSPQFHIPKFNTSVPHKLATPFQPPKFFTSTPKKPQSTTALSSTLKNPSILHQKPLSSTPKTPQFHTKNPSVHHTHRCVELKDVWNGRGFCRGNEGRVELRVFWCGTEGFRWWTEGFWILKRCCPCVEPMCGTEGYSIIPTYSSVEFTPKKFTVRSPFF